MSHLKSEELYQNSERSERLRYFSSWQHIRASRQGYVENNEQVPPKEAEEAEQGRHLEQSFGIHLLLLGLSFGQLIERSLAEPPPQPMRVTEQIEALLNLQTSSHQPSRGCITVL